MQQQKKNKDLCDGRRRKRIKMYTEYSKNKMNKKKKTKLIKRYEKIMFIKNFMKRSFFFVFNIMNTYMLNQFYCSSESSLRTSRICGSILYK